MKTYSIQELTKSAYIGFTSRNEFVSKEIRDFTKSDISHAFVGYDSENITEALGNHGNSGVVKNSLFGLMNDEKVNCLYIAVPIYDIDSKDSKKWQDERIGTKYDYFNTMFMQVLYKFVDWLPWQRKTKTAEKKYQCAEYTAHWVDTFAMILDEPISEYSPKQLKSEIECFEHFHLFKRDEKTKLFFRVI